MKKTTKKVVKKTTKPFSTKAMLTAMFRGGVK